MKYLTSLLFAAAAQATSHWKGLLVPELCLKKNDMMTFSGGDKLPDDVELVGDMKNISKMPLWDASTARPSRLTVCMGDKGHIEGLQLSTLTYKPEMEDQGAKVVSDDVNPFHAANILLEAQISDMLEKSVHNGRLYPGEWIGHKTETCDQLEIQEHDRIIKVVAEADVSNIHLHKLTVLMTSGSEHVFGNKKVMDSEDDEQTEKVVMHEWDFNDRKVDILGLSGLVWREGAVTFDHDTQALTHSAFIHGLSFITNECPTRNIHGMAVHDVEAMEARFEKEFEDALGEPAEEALGQVFIIVILTLILSILFSSVVYVCAKNRGSIYRKLCAGKKFVANEDAIKVQADNTAELASDSMAQL